MKIGDLSTMLIALSEKGLRFESPPVGHRKPCADRSRLEGYYPPQGHDQLEFICLIEGEVLLCVNDQWLPWSSPQPRVFIPGTIHSERHGGQRQVYRMLWGALFPNTFIFHTTAYHPLTGYSTSSHRMAIAPPMVDFTWRISQKPGFHRDRQGRALFHAGLMECLQYAVHKPELADQSTDIVRDRIVEQVKDYILRNYRSEVTLKQMASMMHYSPGHLNALFRRIEGTSIHRFINEVRLRKAYQLLNNDCLLVKQAAFATGFRDPLYFSRLFLRRFGCSPSEIRRPSIPNRFEPTL